LEFFDKLSSVTKSAVEKTTNKVELTRLNIKMNTINSSIAAEKTKIGEHYWQKFDAGEPCPPELTATLDAIKNYLSQIDSIQKDKQAILDREKQPSQNLGPMLADGVICPSCGAHNVPDALFCFECGKSIAAAPQYVNKTDTGYCTDCGAEMPLNAIFCPQCGAGKQS
jgi:ribosomal protein L40E